MFKIYIRTQIMSILNFEIKLNLSWSKSFQSVWETKFIGSSLVLLQYVYRLFFKCCWLFSASVTNFKRSVWTIKLQRVLGIIVKNFQSTYRMNENSVHIHTCISSADLASVIHWFFVFSCSKFVVEFLLAFKGNLLQICFAKRQRKINNILASIELNKTAYRTYINFT